MPIAKAYGIDPVHFGVMATLNLSIGLITPPYGICLYVSAMVRSVAETSFLADAAIPSCMAVRRTGNVAHRYLVPSHADRTFGALHPQTR